MMELSFHRLCPVAQYKNSWFDHISIYRSSHRSARLGVPRDEAAANQVGARCA